LKFSGYMELSYLHPNVFRLDEQILDNYGLSLKEKYSVLRFVSWNAHHDYGHKGLSIQNKIKAVEAFSKYGKVLITSEKALPAELEPYRMKINPTHIHHILGGASLFYGESATMASESAVLGTPAVYLDDVGRGYTKPPKLLVFDGKTKEIVPDVELEYNSEDTQVTILSNTFGINNTTPVTPLLLSAFLKVFLNCLSNTP